MEEDEAVKRTHGVTKNNQQGGLKRSHEKGKQSKSSRKSKKAIKKVEKGRII